MVIEIFLLITGLIKFVFGWKEFKGNRCKAFILCFVPFMTLLFVTGIMFLFIVAMFVIAEHGSLEGLILAYLSWLTYATIISVSILGIYFILRSYKQLEDLRKNV